MNDKENLLNYITLIENKVLVEQIDDPFLMIEYNYALKQLQDIEHFELWSE